MAECEVIPVLWRNVKSSLFYGGMLSHPCSMAECEIIPVLWRNVKSSLFYGGMLSHPCSMAVCEGWTGGGSLHNYTELY
jgi:hypothetical protein